MTLSYKNAEQEGFAAGQVYFQVTCPAGQVAVGTIFEAWYCYDNETKPILYFYLHRISDSILTVGICW